MKHIEPITIGTFEPVQFPDFKLGEMTAKIDTGAFTGALHCTQIREEDTKDGKVLVFSPFDQPKAERRVDKFAVDHVRSSNGEKKARYFVETKIIIQGKTYPIVLSLADRSEMKWPVLIGRKFLRRNHFLVDSRKGAQYLEQVKLKKKLS